jgi:TPR repeat protein
MRTANAIRIVRGILLFVLACSDLTGCKVVNAVDGHNRRVRIQDRMMQNQLDADAKSFNDCAINNISSQILSKQNAKELAVFAVNSCDAAQFRNDYLGALHRHSRLDREPEPTDAMKQAREAADEMIARTQTSVIRKIENERATYAENLAKMRASKNPWDKYLLFSALSAGTIEPLDPDEITRTAREAFAGFGECAKETDPSCMDMYGELILRGADTLDAKGKTEARRKALYWLTLAARYGYEPARKVLVSEGADIPTPDLAMEKLQKEANNIAMNTQISAERIARDKAARDYELIRETRRQTEQMIWANLFPKMVNCTSNKIGSYTYTNCW